MTAVNSTDNSQKSWLTGLKNFFIGEGSITDMGDQYPVLSDHFESSIKNLFIIGNIAGSPDIKAALNSGYKTAHYIIDHPEKHNKSEPIIILGAGPAGIAAAIELKIAGYNPIILEKRKLLGTIKAFQKDLILYYAVTGDKTVKGVLPFRETTAGELLKEWEPIIASFNLDIREGFDVLSVTKQSGKFVVTGKNEKLESNTVIAAFGKLIHLEKVEIAEEKVKSNKSNVKDTALDISLIKKVGVQIERQWTTNRLILLAAMFVFTGLFYIYKKADPGVFTLSPDFPLLGGRNLGSLYPIIYSFIVVGFGIRAMLRWKKINPYDTIQPKKFLMLMFFQVTFFCIIPEFLLNNWLAYGLAYPFGLMLVPETIHWQMNPYPEIANDPLQQFFSGILSDPSQFYFYWILLLSFVALPLLVKFTGKQYCSWVCSCGGLAETLGDDWRHYSPKGPKNIARERIINWIVIWCAVGVIISVSFYETIINIGNLTFKVGQFNADLYAWVVNMGLAGWIPVALYPFMGGKTWCRYWCPTAGLLHFISKIFTKQKISNYKIESNKERCITCNMCSRYCEVGIDVKYFAVRGLTLDNQNSSCIGCGICITVCPTETLKFDYQIKPITITNEIKISA